jgi:putative transposase
MKRKRHTEEQIIAILKEHEAGMKTADLCRKHGISEASFYNWKAKYSGLEVSEAKRLRGLELLMIVVLWPYVVRTLWGEGGKACQ